MQAHEPLDVLIVGGGPAGAATALSALREDAGLRVGILEKSRYEASRVGEALSPGAVGLLRHLGALPRFERAGHLPAFGNSAAWGSAEVQDRDFLFTPFGHGWHLNRRRFDADLAADAQAAGVQLWTDARVESLQRCAIGWRVEVRHEGALRILHARCLVDASGRSQSLARHVGARRRLLDTLVGLAAYFPSAAEAHRFTLVEACEEGWFYSSRVPGDGVRQPAGWWVALMCDASRMRAERLRQPQAWWSRLQHGPQTRARLGDVDMPVDIQSFAAQSAVLDPMFGEDWLAVGDAAASHDPLSSSGIARALDGGVRAGILLARTRGDSGREAELQALAEAQDAATGQYLGTWSRYYQMEQRWPDSAFWRRRQRLVTLDPRSTLRTRAAGGTTMPPAWPVDLLPVDAASLLTLCMGPAQACGMVARHPMREHAGDLAIILGLQGLLQAGALTLQ